MARFDRPLRWIARGGVRPLQAGWRRFCRAVVTVFYRSCEVNGLEHLPRNGPVLLCANHPNALIDAVVIQAAVPRNVHPLARSGLFRNPLLRPFLAVMQAVPVHRRQDAEADPARNAGMFEQCYRMLAAGRALLIFPEGETHADPSLRALRSGAARLALGALERTGSAPAVVPAGLNFTDVGRFRSKVLLRFHPPLEVGLREGEPPEEAAVRITAAIDQALRRVTLNTETWEEQDFMRRVERFFRLRQGKYRRRSLTVRFRALQKLGETLHRVRSRYPEQIAATARRLNQFERLCGRFGVSDYHLTVSNSPALVMRFVVRSLAVIGLVLPLAAWGTLNSIVPYLLTGYLAPRLAADRYQYDTAKAALGMGIFGAFWAGQTVAVNATLGAAPALLYALALPPTAALALYARRERERILENMRVFFLFLRKQEVRDLLEVKRTELEQELRRIVQLAYRPGPGA